MTEDNKKRESNALYKLLYAFKMRFDKWCNVLINRINCEHNDWEGIYCYDTGLFMYKKCKKCGKKSTRR